MGIDMEMVRVQLARDSLLPTNDPEYSGITTTDSDKFSLYHVRACISHSKHTRKLDFQTAHEMKDSLQTVILDNNLNNILHHMMSQFNEAKATKKLTDQALKDVQAKLAEAKRTRRKRGTGRTAAAAELEPLSSLVMASNIAGPADRRIAQRDKLHHAKCFISV
ncbi:hypothetical protein B0H14DRAFT_2589652 [Mycena olivaceomarginata]|nr:hypothetical protein B0H14DRAFT_2589652 [Mycena olivaceomarginata]